MFAAIDCLRCLLPVDLRDFLRPCDLVALHMNNDMVSTMYNNLDSTALSNIAFVPGTEQASVSGN